MKKNRCLWLLIAIVLTLSLLVSCTLTGKPAETVDTTDAGTVGPDITAPAVTTALPATAAPTVTTAPTETDEPQPADPLAVGDVIARLSGNKNVVIGRSDLTFDLTREEIDALLADFDELDRLLEEGTDCEAFIALYDEISDVKLDRLETQDRIIYILWCCDLSDPLTEAAYLYVDKLYSDLVARLNRMYETIWQSPFNTLFYRGWSDDEIAYARQIAAGSTDEMTALVAENNDLLIAFRALSDKDETFYSESARLFLETAKNNNRIAELLGYGNYMEYAYPEIYSRDYSPDDTAVFRTCFCDGLMPVLSSLAARLDRDEFAFQSLSYSRYMQFYRFLFDDIRTTYSSVVDRYAAAVGEIAPDYLTAYRDFWDTKNYYFLSDEDGAYQGAFTLYLPDDEIPVIYFGPGYHAPNDFLHEFGHYYAALKSEDGGEGISYDLAETQSQGNEFLFTCWYELNESSSRDVANAIAEYKIFEILSTVLNSSLVNDFECYVYTHLDELAPEDLDGILISLCDEYGGYDTVKAALGYDPELYWHYVVMESPGYYVSYAVSAIPALSLYATAKSEGFEVAVEAYEKLIEADLDLGFTDALKLAGIGSPFDAATYAAIAAQIAPDLPTEQ